MQSVFTQQERFCGVIFYKRFIKWEQNDRTLLVLKQFIKSELLLKGLIKEHKSDL